MNWLNYAKELIRGKGDTASIPEGVCPNCWGRQEYGNKMYQALEDEGIDLNNAEARLGWIEAYAVKHFDGIKVPRKPTEEQYECAVCKTRYESI